MQETAVSLIPKEELDYLKEDERFIEFIKNELTRKITDRLIQVLESEDEIILKKSVLSVSDYPSLHSVEYRKILDWKPLIRCKDCKWRDESTCLIHGAIWKDNDFCSQGEREEEDE